jgi:hypothetical protein
MAIIILSNGVQVNLRQAPLRVATDVIRRISRPAPAEQIEYAVWCERILRAVEPYIRMTIDAERLAQARETFASWAEHGYQAPRSDKMCYLLWCIIQDETRADFRRIVDPIVAPSAKTGLQQRLDQRRKR